MKKEKLLYVQFIVISISNNEQRWQVAKKLKHFSLFFFYQQQKFVQCDLQVVINEALYAIFMNFKCHSWTYISLQTVILPKNMSVKHFLLGYNTFSLNKCTDMLKKAYNAVSRIKISQPLYHCCFTTHSSNLTCSLELPLGDFTEKGSTHMGVILPFASIQNERVLSLRKLPFTSSPCNKDCVGLLPAEHNVFPNSPDRR